MLADRWTARISVPKAELAEALAMMTIKAFSFLLNGPCESCFKNEVTDVLNLIYRVQKAKESAARNEGLHENPQDIGDDGKEH